MKRKDILMFLVPTFIFVVAWIGFTIYHNVTSSTVSEVLNIQSSPISPNFDVATIEKLKSRKNVAPIYQVGAPANVPGQPIATPTPVSSTASAQTATSGGNLLQ